MISATRTLTPEELSRQLILLRKRMCCLSTTSGGGGGTGSFVSVEIGTPEADALGLISGTTTYTNPLYVGKQVEVERDLGSLPDQLWNGSTYYTKPNLSDNFITFSDPLVNGDHIKIRIL